MTRRLAWLAALAVASAPALAQEKKHELKLARTWTAGESERIELNVTQSVDATKPKAQPERVLKTTIERHVLELEDGAPWREVLTFRGTKLAIRNGDALVEKTDDVAEVATITRTSKARTASLASGELTLRILPMPEGLALAAWVRRDPDALSRLIAPTAAVAEKESWTVEPKPLLKVLGPERAKLVGDQSSATATLDSIKEKKGVLEAQVSLAATLAFRDPDGAKDAVDKIKLFATIRAAIDGSGPRKEDMEVQWRKVDGTKWVEVVQVVRHRGGADDAK